MQRPLPCFPLHTNAYAGTHITCSFEFNPQTHSQPHIYTCFHTLPLLHAEARTLSRLIISQVCHLRFIWASEVLTSISLSTLAFSPFCHLSVSHCFSLRSHHFLLFLSLSLCLSPSVARYCWGKSFTGCVRCQIRWKTARDKGVKKEALRWIKNPTETQVWFSCQASFYSRKTVRSLAVVPVM